jgi:hypothetical protein
VGLFAPFVVLDMAQVEDDVRQAELDMAGA